MARRAQVTLEKLKSSFNKGYKHAWVIEKSRFFRSPFQTNLFRSSAKLGQTWSNLTITPRMIKWDYVRGVLPPVLQVGNLRLTAKKPVPKTEPKPKLKTEPKPKLKTKPKPTPKAKPKPEPKSLKRTRAEPKKPVQRAKKLKRAVDPEWEP